MRTKFLKYTLLTFTITAMLTSMACGKKSPKVNSDEETTAVVEESTEAIKELAADNIKISGLNGEADSITIKPVETDSDDYNNVTDKLDALEDYHYVTYEVYNIDLLKDNAKVQPDGSVTIALNLSEDIINADGDGYDVYRTESDGEITKLENSVEGNVITFNTEHFSIYTVVKTDSTYVEPEPETEVESETYTSNDTPAPTQEQPTEAPAPAPAPVNTSHSNDPRVQSVLDNNGGTLPFYELLWYGDHIGYFDCFEEYIKDTNAASTYLNNMIGGADYSGSNGYEMITILNPIISKLGGKDGNYVGFEGGHKTPFVTASGGEILFTCVRAVDAPICHSSYSECASKLDAYNNRTITVNFTNPSGPISY